MAIQIDGSAVSVDFGDVANPFHGADEITWAITLDVSSRASSLRILGQWSAARVVLVQISNTDEIGWVIENDSNQRRGWLTSSSPIAATGRHRIAGRWRYNAGAHDMAIYVNGVEATGSYWFTAWTTASSTIANDTGGNTFLGEDPDGGNGIDADYSHFAIWTGYLNDAEMAAVTLDATPPVARPRDLATWCPLRNTSDLIDRVGALSGTLLGTPEDAEDFALLHPAAAFVPLAGAAPSASPDLTAGVELDGAAYYSISPGPTGLADGGEGFVSFWVKPDAAALQYVVGISAGFFIQLAANGSVYVYGENSGSSNVLSLLSSPGSWNAGEWNHIAASWDISTGTLHIYVNGVDADGGSSTSSNDDIEYTRADFLVGALTSGSGSKLDGCLGEFVFDDALFDISNSTNLEKFRSVDGNPVSQGADGSTGLGSQPLVYLSGGVDQFADNFGTGGPFTENGSPVDCPIPFNCAISISADFGTTIASILDAQGAMTLAADLGVSNATLMDALSAMQLAAEMGVSPSVVATLSAAVTFDIDADFATTSDQGNEGTITLAATYGVSKAPLLTAEVSASMGAEFGVTPNTDGAVDGSVSFPVSLAESVAAQMQAEGSITLALTKGVGFGGGLNLESAVSMALDAGIAPTAIISLEGAISLPAALSIADSVAAAFSADVPLGVTLDIANAAIAEMEAAASLGAEMGYSVSAGQTLSSGVSIAVEVGITAVGATVTAEITTPAGRRLLIQADDRTLMIMQDDRTLKIQ